MMGNRKRMIAVSVLVAAGMILGACSTPTPTADLSAVQTAAVQTAEAEMTQAVPEATATHPAPGPTAIPEVGVPVIATPNPGDPAAIANYNTYIFGGPGTDYVVYGAFLGGDTALVTGVSDDSEWWVISVPPAPQGIGWVSAAWVTVANVEGVPTVAAPPVPPTTAMVPPGPDDPQATALVNTYVRSGPGTTYPAYGVAPAGATARVIGKSADGQWWVVRLDPSRVGAGYGWVSASTVQASNVESVPVIEAPAPSPPAEVSPPPEGAPSATAVEYVNVRSGAGTCFAVYGVAAPGASAEVTGKSSDGQWWQVRVPTQFSSSGLAWVSASYVITTNTEAVQVVETEPCAAVPVPPPTTTFACYLSSQNPADYTEMAPDTSFTMAWGILNTSNDTWSDAELQFVESGSGGTFHTGPDTVDIGDVAAGGSYTSDLPATSPSADGTYGEVWQITSGGTAVCEFWMIIEVAE